MRSGQSLRAREAGRRAHARSRGATDGWVEAVALIAIARARDDGAVMAAMRGGARLARGGVSGMVLFSMFPRGDGRERHSRARFEGDVSVRAGRAMWARRGRFGRPDGRGCARTSGHSSVFARGRRVGRCRVSFVARVRSMETRTGASASNAMGRAKPYWLGSRGAREREQCDSFVLRPRTRH